MTAWFVLVESNTTGSGRLFCHRARRRGMRPVVFARDPARYPYLAEDAIDQRLVDTADPVAILTACADLDDRVAGMTSSSEYFVATASAVAGQLGLDHPDPDAIRDCRDKYRQRARLAQHGVPCPSFAQATTPPEAVAQAARIGLPVVVKPVAGSGSIGVRRCDHLDEVEAAAAAVLLADPAELALPQQRAVVVEAYLTGPEYSVELLDETVVGITHKHLGAEPYFVEIGHDFPAELSRPDQEAIGATAVAALRALGLGWGGAHVELRYTAAGPSLIEVNPRLAGGMIPRMVQEATGIDMIDYVVARAAGQADPPQPTRRRFASIRFLVAPGSGRLTEVRGLDAAREIPAVVEVGLTRQPGQDLVLKHSFQDRIGYVIAAADDGTVAARAADAGVQALAARIEPAALIGEGSAD